MLLVVGYLLLFVRLIHLLFDFFSRSVFIAVNILNLLELGFGFYCIEHVFHSFIVLAVIAQNKLLIVVVVDVLTLVSLSFIVF